MRVHMMIDYEKYFDDFEISTADVLSNKKNSVTLRINRVGDDKPRILKIYRKTVPAYRQLIGCSRLPVSCLQSDCLF